MTVDAWILPSRLINGTPTVHGRRGDDPVGHVHDLIARDSRDEHWPPRDQVRYLRQQPSNVKQCSQSSQSRGIDLSPLDQVNDLNEADGRNARLDQLKASALSINDDPGGD